MVTTISDKKMIFNALNGANNCLVKDSVDHMFKIEDIYQVEKDIDGEDRIFTALFTDNGSIYTSISPTFADAVDSFYNTFGEDEFRNVDVKIVAGRSKAGREFFSIDVV